MDNEYKQCIDEDELANLSKTQKKSIKAKSKGKCVNKGVKNDFDDLQPLNFVVRGEQVNGMLKGIEKDESKELILPKSTIDDPLIATVQKDYSPVHKRKMKRMKNPLLLFN